MEELQRLHIRRDLEAEKRIKGNFSLPINLSALKNPFDIIELIRMLTLLLADRIESSISNRGIHIKYLQDYGFYFQNIDDDMIFVNRGGDWLEARYTPPFGWGESPELYSMETLIERKYEGKLNKETLDWLEAIKKQREDFRIGEKDQNK